MMTDDALARTLSVQRAPLGLFHVVTACFTPKMASNLTCEGLLAAVRVLGLIKRLSTGPREVVVPENLIWM